MDIFSIPPAITISESPHLILCTAKEIAFIPEAHTLFIVVQGVFSGIPAEIAACLQGAWPKFA